MASLRNQTENHANCVIHQVREWLQNVGGQPYMGHMWQLVNLIKINVKKKNNKQTNKKQTNKKKKQTKTQGSTAGRPPRG